MEPESTAEMPPDETEAIPAEDPVRPDHRAQMVALYLQGRRGSNWFYWIAGLSLVNSAIILAEGNITFVVGLGVMQIADGLAAAIAQHQPHVEWTAKGIAIVFDLFVAGIFAGFGWLSGRRYLPIFVTGMILYLMDGLIFLYFGDWFPVAFHIFALVCMWSGFQGFRKLRQMELLGQEPDGEIPQVVVPAE
jgi:hypothetical protein